MRNYFIGEKDFRVFLPEVQFVEKAEDADKHNSRKISGIMSTERKDRQGEIVLAKGLDFDEFLKNGHFNDNHSQETSAIVGYPEKVEYHKSLAEWGVNAPGWTCEGYVLKGTRRSDGIWELAQALTGVPNKKLGFSIEGKVERRKDKTIEKARIRNVAITNCFPGDTKVVGAANKVTRRWYSGEMIEIHLATGEKLTGTPNHPVFTQRGWVALGEIDEVSDRIGRFDADLAKAASLPQIAHDVNHMPSTLEEIFNSSLISGNPLWVAKAGERNFHGDGAGSDVDVVLAKGFLRNNLKSAFEKKFGQEALAAADKEPSGLFGFGLSLKLFLARLFASASPVRSQGVQLSFSGAPLGVFQPVCFLNGSSDPISEGHIPNGDSGHSVFGGDKGRRLSPSIGFGNISLKRRFYFSGHVFNLDTTQGWYEANGIVAHNCPVNTDCTWDLLAKSFDAPEVAEKAMMAGYGTSPATQSGGGAVRVESLESDADKRKKKRVEALKRAMAWDDMVKAIDVVMEMKPGFDEDAAASFVQHLFKNGGKL